MSKATINDLKKTIAVDIPLTTTSGKIRTKNRSSFYVLILSGLNSSYSNDPVLIRVKYEDFSGFSGAAP